MSDQVGNQNVGFLMTRPIITFMISNYVIAKGLKKAVDKFEEPHDDNYLKLSEHVYLLDKKASWENLRNYLY